MTRGNAQSISRLLGTHTICLMKNLTPFDSGKFVRLDYLPRSYTSVLLWYVISSLHNAWYRLSISLSKLIIGVVLV